MGQSKAREGAGRKQVTLTGKSSFCGSRGVKKEVRKRNRINSRCVMNRNMTYLKGRDRGSTKEDKVHQMET